MRKQVLSSKLLLLTPFIILGSDPQSWHFTLANGKACPSHKGHRHIDICPIHHLHVNMSFSSKSIIMGVGWQYLSRACTQVECGMNMSLNKVL